MPLWSICAAGLAYWFPSSFFCFCVFEFFPFRRNFYQIAPHFISFHFIWFHFIWMVFYSRLRMDWLEKWYARSVGQARGNCFWIWYSSQFQCHCFAYKQHVHQGCTGECKSNMIYEPIPSTYIFTNKFKDWFTKNKLDLLLLINL